MYDDFPGVDRAWNDRRILATPGVVEVQARVHQEYSSPQIDIIDWALTRIHWRGDEHVLDVGCGAGNYIDAVQRRISQGRLVVGDLSLRLIHKMRDHETLPPQRLALDVQDLPFADDTFDVVLVSHMLHQVPDIHRALGEIRRVLHPTGLVLVMANSGHHLLRLGGHLLPIDDLYQRAYTLLGVPNAGQQPLRWNMQRFQLENGTVLLAQHFHAVARHDLPAILAFPGVDAVTEYLESTRPSHEPNLPPGVTWNLLMEIMAAQVDQIVDYFGSLEIDKLSGVFVASDAEDFTAPPPML